MEARDRGILSMSAVPPVKAKKKPYDKPRIVHVQKIEALAAICESALIGPEVQCWKSTGEGSEVLWQ